jgi:hypothetical protein
MQQLLLAFTLHRRYVEGLRATISCPKTAHDDLFQQVPGRKREADRYAVFGNLEQRGHSEP